MQKPKLIVGLGLTVGLLLGAQTRAQQPAATVTATAKVGTVLPPKAVAVMHMDGPARMAELFKGTRLGKLGAAPEMKAWWEAVWKDAVPMLKAPLEGMELEADEALEAIAAFDGRLTMAFYAPLKDAPDFNEAPFHFNVLVVLSPGKTKLDKLHAKINKVIAESPQDDLEDLEIGDRTLKLGPGPGTEGRSVLPFLHKGSIVLAFGTDPKSTVQQLFAARDPEPIGSDKCRKSAFGMHIAAGRFLRMLSEAADASEDAQAGVVMSMINGIGLTSIENMEVWMASEGKHVIQEFVVEFNDKTTGVLACLMPPKQQTKSPLMQIFPYDIHQVSGFFLSLPTAYDRMRKVVTESEMPFNLKDLEETFEEQTGVRLKEDLLDHMTGHMIMLQQGVGDLGMDEDEDVGPMGAVRAGIGGHCYGVFLRDGKAFAKSLEALIRKRGLHAARKTTDFRGEKVRLINFMGLDIHYVTTDRMALVAFEDAGAKALRSTLARALDRAQGKEPQPMPKAWTERIGALPQNTYSISQVEIGGIFRDIVDQLLNAPEMEFFEELDAGERQEDPDLMFYYHMLKLFRVAPRLMRDHKVESSIAGLIYGNRRIRSRTIW